MGRLALWIALALLVGMGASWLLLGAWWLPRSPEATRTDPGTDAGREPELTAAGTKPPDDAGPVDPDWLLAELQSDDPLRREAAYEKARQQETLAYDETLAKYLVPFLVSTDARARSWAYQLLRRMGGAVVPVLAPYYEADDPRMRREALTFLMTTPGAGYEWMRPRIEALLVDEDPNVARVARSVVSVGVPYDEQVAQHLVDSLRPTDRAEVDGAEKALARMGPRGIAHLLAILDDPRSDLRLNALWGLRFARPEDLRPHLPRLAREMASGEEDERVAAIEAVGAMMGDCEVCLPALTRALEDESIAVQQAALTVIESMRERATDAVPRLLALLADDDERLAGRVAALLERTKLDPARAMPALAEALSGDAGDAVARALAAYGPDALPHALKVFAGGGEDGRYAALLALGRLGPVAREIGPALPALIRSEDYDLARRAMDVAGRIGPDAASTIPAVLERLWEGDVVTPGEAATVLMRLGDAAQRPLHAALESTDPERRRTTVEVLSACWGWSGFALDELAGFLDASDEHLRYVAARAIQVSVWPPPEPGVFWSSADPKSDPALRARVRTLMERAVDDPAESVRRLARQAIHQIDRLERQQAR